MAVTPVTPGRGNGAVSRPVAGSTRRRLQSVVPAFRLISVNAPSVVHAPLPASQLSAGGSKVDTVRPSRSATVTVRPIW